MIDQVALTAELVAQGAYAQACIREAPAHSCSVRSTKSSVRQSLSLYIYPVALLSAALPPFQETTP